MKLHRVSVQGHESLIDYFDELGNHTEHRASYRPFADRMIALIRHLEQTAEGPPQWVTTSHFWFYIASVDHWDPHKARVFVYARQDGFEIRYRSTYAFIDWEQSFTSIQVETVEEASATIAWALQVAIPDPPERFPRDPGTGAR